MAAYGKYVLWESTSETITTESILTLVDLEHGLCMPWQDLDMGYDIDDMDVR